MTTRSDILADQYGLPDGWSISTLGNVCTINPPKPKTGVVAGDAEVTFVPMPAVDADSGTIATPQIRGFDKVRKGFTAFRENDVIMAKITPCMENGKAAIAKGLRNGLGFGSTEFHVFRSREAVLPEYVYYFIRQESFRSAAEMEMTGSVGQKRVPADFVEGAEIPIPPLAEQKRIVEAVERLTARVDAARERLAKVPFILKRFRQAVLAAACSGRLTEDWRNADADDDLPFGWKVKPLASAIAGLEQGWSPKCENEPSTLHDEWGVIKTTAVQAMRFVEVENKRLPNAIKPRTDLELRSGDLLITRAGPRARAAIACLVESVRPRLIVCDKTYRFRARTDIATSTFLLYFLNAPSTMNELDEMKTGISDSGVNLTQDKFRELPVLLPPISEQTEIVRRVEALMKLADTIEQRVALASARADKTTQAILAKAFRGELVPTEADLARAEDRDFEPASDLIARIQSANDSAPSRHHRANGCARK